MVSFTDQIKELSEIIDRKYEIDEELEDVESEIFDSEKKYFLNTKETGNYINVIVSFVYFLFKAWNVPEKGQEVDNKDNMLFSKSSYSADGLFEKK